MESYYYFLVAALVTAQTVVTMVGADGEGVKKKSPPALRSVVVTEAVSTAVTADSAAAEMALRTFSAIFDRGTDETGEFISSLRSRRIPMLSMAIDPSEDPKLQVYMIEASKGLYPEARNALARIEGAARRLVALRGYLRKGRGIREQWAWSDAQIARYKRTTEYRSALVDVSKVKAKFAELNPGYTLKVNVEVRTLDQQIGSWNQTGSIAGAAVDLRRRCLEVLADSTFAEIPTKENVAKFQKILRDSKLTRIPTLAVPGLSEHGQLRAFDFIIMKGDTIVAGTDAGSVGAVWDKSGWTQKLKDAIAAVSPKFIGPLASPYEPWHYSYRP